MKGSLGNAKTRCGHEKKETKCAEKKIGVAPGKLERRSRPIFTRAKKLKECRRRGVRETGGPPRPEKEKEGRRIKEALYNSSDQGGRKKKRPEPQGKGFKGKRTVDIRRRKGPSSVTGRAIRLPKASAEKKAH